MIDPEERDKEEAALWVARHMEKVVDATAFSQWLAGAPGRREAFEALWASCMDDAVTEGLRRYDEREPQSLHEAARSGMRPRPLIAGLIAAACVAALALSWPRLHFAFMPAQDYATTAGQVRRFELADGSTVTLNGASRIAVKIGDGRRDVALKAGEALFDVRHDAARPFTVTASSGRVTVLGTRFDLALNGDQVDLTVERGLVRFESESDEQNAVLVPAAHRAALSNGRIVPPTGYQAELASSWQDGWLEVANTPLSQILPRLQRWTTRSIIAEDEALLKQRVAGRFRLSNPHDLLDSLGTLYGFKVVERDQSYLLVPQ